MSLTVEWHRIDLDQHIVWKPDPYSRAMTTVIELLEHLCVDRGWDNLAIYERIATHTVICSVNNYQQCCLFRADIVFTDDDVALVEQLWPVVKGTNLWECIQ